MCQGFRVGHVNVCEMVRQADLPEDVVEHVEAAVFRVQCKRLRKLQRDPTVIDSQCARDEDNERIAIACRLRIARLDFMLHLLER